MKIRFRPVLLITILALLTALMACSPVTVLNALTPSGTDSLQEGVNYGPGERHKLDIYTPEGTAPTDGWPVVVFFYGGSWNHGERSEYRFVGESLASRGVMTLVADYRLYPEVRYPDFLYDCAQALAFGLREARTLGGNPDRMFVMGHSAGAYNAAMLALDPRWLGSAGHSPSDLAGWIGLAGPYDFLPIRNPDVRPVFNHPDYPPGTQPMEHARNSTVPAFLAAATEDELVNPERNTIGLASRLEEANVSVDLNLYDNVNHMTLMAALSRPLSWLAPVLDDVVAFVSMDRTEINPTQAITDR